MLVNVLLQKFPEDIQLIISRKMPETLQNEDWELNNMLHILKQEIEARDAALLGESRPDMYKTTMQLEQHCLVEPDSSKAANIVHFATEIMLQLDATLSQIFRREETSYAGTEDAFYVYQRLVILQRIATHR